MVGNHLHLAILILEETPIMLTMAVALLTEILVQILLQLEDKEVSNNKVEMKINQIRSRTSKR